MVFERPRKRASQPSRLSSPRNVFQRQYLSKEEEQAFYNRPIHKGQYEATSLLPDAPYTPPVQTKREEGNNNQEIIQEKSEEQPNKTGLPDNLKTGVENLSGYSLDHVRVHYNSPKPAQLQALAYTQGTDIHVAPRQEQHLPHETWHVVQQMQGRVKPTMQMQGVQINDDEGLEREADVMGYKAKNFNGNIKSKDISQSSNTANLLVTQPKWLDDKESEYYKWDTMLNGVRWFHHKKRDLMYYMVEDVELAGAGGLAHAGIKKSKSRAAWVDLIGADTMMHEDASIEETERQSVADKDDHEALIAQFEDLTSSGGLLMHAVANGEEVESIGYLLDQGLTLEQIRMGDYRTKLLSYIRSDLTMKTFAFRRMGLLVDWKRIWDIVGYKQGKATIYEEDQQSSRTALDAAESYGEAGGDMDLMGREFDTMARRQNELKSKSKNIGNWNEVLTYNAVTAGVIGLLWVVDGSQRRPLVSYEDFFTEEKKQELYAQWLEKTGMKTMPIYVYTHMGNPRGKRDLAEARERLGKRGASSLILRENYSPPE
ncbi:eCIS core domain-containing protein [Crocosphaera sp.]|uniref:eCIS core domain-containing protein n=1 Tax=Crocosphaera sp. TaxID=2729996 RepID=UPI003F276D4F|nr:DUF4157 domain-containing protein [Crocosphaera sp.]